MYIELFIISSTISALIKTATTPASAATPVPPLLPIHNELNIKKGLFTIQELNNATKIINNGKACGLDEIPAEVWKLTEFQNIFINLCNSVYSQNKIRTWTEGCLLPFSKKGDIAQANNYRGITLTSIAANIYNLMLLNRIRPEIEVIIWTN